MTTTLILIVDDPELDMRRTRAVQRSAGTCGGAPCIKEGWICPHTERTP